MLTFAMNLAAVLALLDPKYSHSLTPYVIGMTVFQGVLGLFFNFTNQSKNLLNLQPDGILEQAA